MPVYGTGENGEVKWAPGRITPPTHVGNKYTQAEALQKRIDGSVVATSRILDMFRKGKITEEEKNKAIFENAQGVRMDPQELEYASRRHLTIGDTATAIRAYNQGSLSRKNLDKIIGKKAVEGEMDPQDIVYYAELRIEKEDNSINK